MTLSPLATAALLPLLFLYTLFYHIPGAGLGPVARFRKDFRGYGHGFKSWMV